MKKKILTLCLSVMISVSLIGVAGCASTSVNKIDDKVTIGMVTDIGGINDGSFNETAWKGLRKASEDFNVDVKFLESTKDSDYISNIETFVDEDVDLILTVGFNTTSAIEEAANAYPDKDFAIIDGSFESEIPSNVKNIVFNEHEAGFLAGVVASQASKDGNVGFIGGMEVPAVDKYKYGYMAGVLVSEISKGKKVEEVKTQVAYANSFTDAAKGRAIAEQMINNDADVIFHAAGPVGNGMFEALKEKELFGIGVDTDQNAIAPETVITSAVKNLDVATYELANEVAKDRFEGGTITVNTLSNNGVGIAPLNDKVDISMLNMIESYKEKITNKTIVVPSTKEEYNDFIKTL